MKEVRDSKIKEELEKKLKVYLKKVDDSINKRKNSSKLPR